MNLALYQEQTQRIIMTQQMKQAIQLLQCTSEELHDTILAELIRNPLIEYKPAPALVEVPLTASFPSGLHMAKNLNSASLSKGNPLEQATRVNGSMIDDLEQQLILMKVAKEDLLAARKLLGCLNEHGYLECTEKEGQRLCGGAQKYARALALVQQCDPVGIGARNLRECLLLQAHNLETPLRNLVVGVIESHLEDVATRKLQVIAKSLGVSISEVQSAVDCIRRLNPRPNSGLGVINAHYVVPEVIVKEVDGQYQVLINEESQHTVDINREYVLMMRSHDGATMRYISEHLQRAQWLKKSLEQRQTTLYKVAQAMVEVQYRFFTEGPTGLRPLTLHQIATNLGLHESTVSRTVRGKYMQTTRGVFELKYFFSAELHSSDGAVSAQSAKHLIQQLVDSEDAARPLSDEALCNQMLLKRGVRMSRRTVAKYRDELCIPSSAKRRRFV